MEEFFSLLIVDDIDTLKMRYPVHLLLEHKNLIMNKIQEDSRALRRYKKTRFCNAQPPKFNYSKSDRTFLFELFRALNKRRIYVCHIARLSRIFTNSTRMTSVTKWFLDTKKYVSDRDVLQIIGKNDYDIYRDILNNYPDLLQVVDKYYPKYRENVRISP